MSDIARLTDLIEPEAAALGFELVRVKMMPSEAGDGGEALQIMAEDPATGQLIIEQCAELSRRVSDMIDAREEAGEVLIEGAYHLEVSSPGIDRPLTREKDFTNWAGHEARIVMTKGWSGDGAKGSGEQRVFKGELIGIDGDMVQIDAVNLGKVELPQSKIHAAKLVLTDALIAATKPIDTTGAEDIVEDTQEKADD
ncbi:ribosome maturation protein RimP [Erythrobacter sp. F6033]|uniref:ribosome maturation protein RimP n=1 Tax=Erythrobacter sp. F6033 TaxID=2926401 RepID=UPI001FF4FDCD|nr:ribosome maturation protein RimP [Erythrobacter sp. F6033]MCK0127738.1 ribosome maturation protein RimP [Erythrobacter sp. F6033]